MQYRRSDYDVTNTVQVSSVAGVRRAVEELYTRTWPGGPVDKLGAAFTDFERLFNGQLGDVLLGGAGRAVGPYATGRNMRAAGHL
jgi:hypothetical protein